MQIEHNTTMKDIQTHNASRVLRESMELSMSRPDTETNCHCTASYNGSDHCPQCGCEQYETGDCGQTAGGACEWLVRAPSGNPEPDFPEDLWRIVECGGNTTVNEHGSWKCEYGHEHVSFADPARGAYEVEMAFAERQEDRY